MLLLQAKENNVQELSAGQVTTMARNEKVIEKLSGQPATYENKRCLTVAWLNGMLACPPATGTLCAGQRLGQVG